MSDEPRFRGSIRRTLLGWILALALIPLFVVSGVSYLQARRDLRAAAVHELAAVAESKVGYLESWLDHRFMDLRLQAESQANSQFLQQLALAWRDSGVSLGEFVKSYSWTRIVDGPRRDLITMLRTYNYVSDLFLIDTQGNILLSVAAESDLGTNLFTGPYAETEFSRIARETLETGEARLSDFERYAPSDSLVAAFLSAPILDEWGSKIGIFALRIRVDRLFAELARGSSGRETGRTYLVGVDSLLRTTLRAGYERNILQTNVRTEIVENWIASRLAPEDGHPESTNLIMKGSNYQGPLGQNVIGVSRPIHQPGVDWLMVSEVDEREALASVEGLGLIMLILFTLTATSIVGVGIVQARRITEPLIALTRFSKDAARGQLDREIPVQSKDETGELVHAFNQMITARREHEEALVTSIRAAKEAEITLAKRVDDLALANEELDSFAYIASHDLKEPLRGIHNYAHFLLQDHAQHLDEEGRRLLNALPMLSQRLDGLLDSLLRYARMGRKELSFSEVSTHEIAIYELDLMAERIEAAGVEVRVVDELPTLQCDPAVAGDIFRELLANALKYNDKAERWIEIGVRSSDDFPALADRPQRPVFYVRDNGIGIPEKHLRSVFRIFKRLHVRDRFGSGSGAGLTILEKLVKRCGGRIWVESIVDEGSTFFFTLAEESDE